MADLGAHGMCGGYTGGENTRLDITTRLAGLNYLGRAALSNQTKAGGYTGSENTRLSVTTRLAGVAGGSGSPAGGAPPATSTHGIGSGG